MGEMECFVRTLLPSGQRIRYRVCDIFWNNKCFLPDENVIIQLDDTIT